MNSLTPPVLNVLVVDDHYEDIRSYIADCAQADHGGESVHFEGRALEFSFCSDLARAFDLLRFSAVAADVVLLDLHFPEDPFGRDGYWLLERIAEMSTDIGVVMLTQHYREETAFKAGRLRADRFIAKYGLIDRDDPETYRDFFGTLLHVAEAKRSTPELHDREHLALAEPFAATYDREEQSFPATVAFYVFENDLICALTRAALAERERVHVCDIGCGTGRIEELLFREFGDEAERFVIDAVDFSGKMLAELRSKALFPASGDLRLWRGSAERLAMLPMGSADLVLMAFGVPSYTRFHLSLAEAARIARPGAHALFTVYNENSLYYDAEARRGWNDDTRPIAAAANRRSGKLEVGGRREFDCETFSIDSFSRLLRRAGFISDRIHTFPTLHVSLSRDHVARQPDAGATRVEFPHCAAFSDSLYELDRVLSEVAGDRGHYIVMTARRDESIVR